MLDKEFKGISSEHIKEEELEKSENGILIDNCKNLDIVLSNSCKSMKDININIDYSTGITIKGYTFQGINTLSISDSSVTIEPQVNNFNRIYCTRSNINLKKGVRDTDKIKFIGDKVRCGTIQSCGEVTIGGKGECHSISCRELTVRSSCNMNVGDINADHIEILADANLTCSSMSESGDIEERYTSDYPTLSDPTVERTQDIGQNELATWVRYYISGEISKEDYDDLLEVFSSYPKVAEVFKHSSSKMEVIKNSSEILSIEFNHSQLDSIKEEDDRISENNMKTIIRAQDNA
jgi:hypothetical protein